MTTSDGKYTLQPHIATSLKEFPDKLSGAKQIQQFLGIVNYMFDFIPKIFKYKNFLAQTFEEETPRMGFTPLGSNPTIEKISRKASFTANSRTRQANTTDRCQ